MMKRLGPLQTNGPQPSQRSAPLPPLLPPPQRAYAAQMLESIKQEHRAFLRTAKGLKMPALPMQRCGVSDLFEETTLEALDQEPKDLHALADDVLGLPGTDRNASCPNGKPALFLRQLSGSTTCSSSATQGSSNTTSQGSAKGYSSAPAVAPLDSAPTPRRRRRRGYPRGQPGGAPPPLLATRSKGEALVHAALFSFSVGVHQDHGGSSFMEDTSTVLPLRNPWTDPTAAAAPPSSSPSSASSMVALWRAAARDRGASRDAFLMRLLRLLLLRLLRLLRLLLLRLLRLHRLRHVTRLRSVPHIRLAAGAGGRAVLVHLLLDDQHHRCRCRAEGVWFRRRGRSPGAGPRICSMRAGAGEQPVSRGRDGGGAAASERRPLPQRRLGRRLRAVLCRGDHGQAHTRPHTQVVQ